MTSTEPKYHTQHIKAIANSLGLDAFNSFPSVLDIPVYDDPELFPGVPSGPSLRQHYERDGNGVLRRLIPDLGQCPDRRPDYHAVAHFGRATRYHWGNCGVHRLAHLFLTRSAGVSFSSPPDCTAARRLAKQFVDLQAESTRVQENNYAFAVSRLPLTGQSWDSYYVARGLERTRILSHSGSIRRRLRLWRSSCRSHIINNKGQQFDKLQEGVPPPPHIEFEYASRKPSRKTHYQLRFYAIGELFCYFRVKVDSRGVSDWRDSDLWLFTERDLHDLCYILKASTYWHVYHAGRAPDYVAGQAEYLKIVDKLWQRHLGVLWECGRRWDRRNLVGVFWDNVAWSYQARLATDEFVPHSEIMREKAWGKGLVGELDVSDMVKLLADVGVDTAIDCCGMAKLSIYPEVDPYQVVSEQRALHEGRLHTDWEADSDEHHYREGIIMYQRYFFIHLYKNAYDYYPGHIKPGIDEKGWHKNYPLNGVPGACWEEACDVDLTGCMPCEAPSIDNLLQAADAACAPSDPLAYDSIKSYRQAPRHDKRKLLYVLQSDDLPDLGHVWAEMNVVGDAMGDLQITPCGYRAPFSQAISTGTRAERQKDTLRPFYQESAPWSCITSHTERYVRTVLKIVPMSMMGKTLKDRKEDINRLMRHGAQGCITVWISDDKKKYSPHMDPQSQMITADFFAEISGAGAFKTLTNCKFDQKLWYRLNGHLVSYGANGTDREGMRGAQNTWLEIVAQAYCTRRMRGKGLTGGRTGFAAFIDDALRAIPVRVTDESQLAERVGEVIEELELCMKVIGRQLSWDKAYVSRHLGTMLNEVFYDGNPYSGGLKSFVTMHELDEPLVMDGGALEAEYFSKAQGTSSGGCPAWVAHLMYVFETIRGHIRMGISTGGQKNPLMGETEYSLWCVTPIALGGGGLRSMIQVLSTETGSVLASGLGTLRRITGARPMVAEHIKRVISRPIATNKPMDFLRDPTQVHIRGPRIRTQRVAQRVRAILPEIVVNRQVKTLLSMADEQRNYLEQLAATWQRSKRVKATEVTAFYSTTPSKEVDDIIGKIVKSPSAQALVNMDQVRDLRKRVREDIRAAFEAFAHVLHDSVWEGAQEGEY